MGSDLTLRGGLVVDGTGAEPFVGDVVVRNGRIAELGTGLHPGGRVMDVEGLVVAPGFIDIHTHYDPQVLWDPLLGSSLQYGFTTVVIGNCGFGVAPVGPNGDVEYMIQMLSRTEGMSAASLREGLSWSWKSFADYLDELDHPLGPNVVALVPHSPLRHAVMGAAAYERTATSSEITMMQALLGEALAAGAWGFSSSTNPQHNDQVGRPVPSRFADRAEMDAFAEVIGRFGFGVVGMSPGSKFFGLDAEERAVMTALSVRGGASVNWNPIRHDPAKPDLWQISLSASHEAAAVGGRVFGVYNPATNMTAGGEPFSLNNLYMFQSCPTWKPIVYGTEADRIAAFADTGQRRALAADFADDSVIGFMASTRREFWGTLRVDTVFSDANREFAGRTVQEIADTSGRSTMDVVLDIGVGDGLRTVFTKVPVLPDEDDTARMANRAMVTSPWTVAGGTDAGAHLDQGANEGMAAKTLAWRVRDEGSVSLAEAVHMFTAKVAAAIGLADRGALRPGLAADLVVFDLDEIGVGPTRMATDMPGGGSRLVTAAAGIHCTIVGGRTVFEGGTPTGDLPGGLLRSGGESSRR